MKKCYFNSDLDVLAIGKLDLLLVNLEEKVLLEVLGLAELGGTGFRIDREGIFELESADFELVTAFSLVVVV